MGNLPPWFDSLQRLRKTSVDFLQQGGIASYTSRSESNGRRLGYSIFHVQSQSLERDRKSTRLNSSHMSISYAVFCLKKKNHSDVYVWQRPQQYIVVAGGVGDRHERRPS